MSSGAPQETQKSGEVYEKALGIVANVAGDEDAVGLEEKALEEVDRLEEAMNARRKAANKVILSKGKVNGGKSRSDRAVRSLGTKLEGHFESERQEGAEHPEFKRIFKKRTPATYLRAPLDERAEDVAALKAILTDDKTPEVIRKIGAPMVKAIANEQAVRGTHRKAEEALQTAVEREDEQKKKVVSAIRALVGSVQTKFSEDPSRIREVLGYSEPGARSKGAGASKAAKTAKKGKDDKASKDETKAKSQDDAAKSPPEGEGEESGEE